VGEIDSNKTSFKKLEPLSKVSTKKFSSSKIFYFVPDKNSIQGDFETCADILIMSCWLHVELGKNVYKILCQKIK
jgi:hypothetical protein